MWQTGKGNGMPGVSLARFYVENQDKGLNAEVGRTQRRTGFGLLRRTSRILCSQLGSTARVYLAFAAFQAFPRRCWLGLNEGAAEEEKSGPDEQSPPEPLFDLRQIVQLIQFSNLIHGF